jgi:predicted nucleic acid-binding protein
MTRAELFAGRGSEEDLVERLLAPFVEIPLEREIAEQAGRLRRTTGIGLADAVIAAGAQARNLAVLTRNRRDFDRVPSLRLRAP